MTDKLRGRLAIDTHTQPESWWLQVSVMHKLRSYVIGRDSAHDLCVRPIVHGCVAIVVTLIDSRHKHCCCFVVCVH